MVYRAHGSQALELRPQNEEQGWMKRQHQLVDRERVGTLWRGLTEKILCRQCMCTWWVEEEDLEREIPCPRCGHRAGVETDMTKALTDPEPGQTA